MRKVFNLQNTCIVKVQGGVGSVLYKQQQQLQQMKNNNDVKCVVNNFTAEELFKQYLKNTP